MARGVRAGRGAWGLTLAVVVVSSLHAQTCLPGTLRVVVKDSQEALIFNVEVQLDAGRQKLGPEITGSQGTADFTNVPCGTWVATGSKAGFDNNSATIEIHSGAAAEVTIILSPQMVRSSVNVEEKASSIEQSSSVRTEIHPEGVKTLPTNPATVRETLPLVPGVQRAANGELILDGTGEQRSSLVVNQSDQT